MIKPLIDTPRIAELLNDYFGEPVEGLGPIGTGQIASAYSFRVAGKEYIVRFVNSTMAMSFGKDQFIAERTSSSTVHVPPIIHTDVIDDTHFAISRKVPGTPLDQMSDDDFKKAIPDLMKTLDAIHQIDISDTKNYGYFDEKGAGESESWTRFLLNIAEEDEKDEFYGKWHRMFDETFIERELFDYVYERMTALLKYCPADRFLLHADYAFGNVLAQDAKITAVLDWANAMYGDFLYDVAWLNLGYEGFDFQSRFQQYYQDKNHAIPHYRERILCYQCYISLDSQRWYGKSGKQDDYNWMRGRILGLLENSQVGQ